MEILYENVMLNIRRIKKQCQNRVIYAVVKSNAYNHGLKVIAPIMIKEGICNFCVTNIDEAIELRGLDARINILLLGRLYEDDIKSYVDNNIVVSLSKYEDYSIIKNNNLIYQLCVNTGMNRYGLTVDESDKILKNSDFNLRGVYSHLGSSNIRDARYYRQHKKFRKLLSKYDTTGLDIHISNSSDTLYSVVEYNSVRIGMLFYNGVKNNLGLYNTVRVEGKVLCIETVSKGEYIGYDRVFKSSRSCKIAIVNVGYEVGILNIFNIKHVLIKGKKYKVIGKICMNNMFVRVDDFIEENDIVSVIGDLNSILEISKKTGISAYEILLNLKK